MFASRNQMDENAMATRTPGPSRMRMTSPSKSRMGTAGKQRAWAGFDDNENGIASPTKQLNAAGSPQKGFATPGPSRRTMKGSPSKGGAGNAFRSALGDKTNNNQKTPFAGGAKQGGSPQKVKGTSPTKVRRQPLQLAPSASQISARTPVLRNASRDVFDRDVGPIEPQQEEVQAHWTDGLTEDEIYPEIEYMPPRHLIEAHQQVYDGPPELDGLPSVEERIANYKTPNFTSAWGLLPDSQALNADMFTVSLNDDPAPSELAKLRKEIEEEMRQMVAAQEAAENRWPDEIIPAREPQRSAASSALSSKTIRHPIVSTPNTTTTARPRSHAPTTSSTALASKTNAVRTAGTPSNIKKPVLSRGANATVPPASTRKPTVSHHPPTTSVRRIIHTGAASRPPTKTTPGASQKTPSTAPRTQQQPPTIRRLHPALRDIENDELSQMLKRDLEKLEMRIGDDDLVVV